MKLLHIADLHLGKTVNEISMIPDQKYVLQQVLDIIQDRGADGLLIAGDIYDKSIPSEDAVNLFDWFLNELAARLVPTFVISGNHDSDDRLNFGSSLMTQKGIYITGRYQGSIPHVTLTDTFGPVNIYMLPFVKASVVAHYLGAENDEKRRAVSESYDAAVAAAIDAAQIDAGERNVLVAHQFVIGPGRNAAADSDNDGIEADTAGGESDAGTAGTDEMKGTDPELSGSEMATLNVGTVEKINASVFKDFDYTALGHIHRPQRVGSDRIRYAGSPLCYSLREVGQKKSATLVTLGAKGDVSCEEIPLTPLHPMIHLTGTFREILDARTEENQDDYVYATLTDQDLVPDAMSALLAYYPNAMKLDYASSWSGEEPDAGLSESTEQMSFTDLMSSFFETMTGSEPSAEQWEILKEAAQEAGITET